MPVGTAGSYTAFDWSTAPISWAAASAAIAASGLVPGSISGTTGRPDDTTMVICRAAQLLVTFGRVHRDDPAGLHRVVELAGDDRHQVGIADGLARRLPGSHRAAAGRRRSDRCRATSRWSRPPRPAGTPGWRRSTSDADDGDAAGARGRAAVAAARRETRSVGVLRDRAATGGWTVLEGAAGGGRCDLLGATRSDGDRLADRLRRGARRGHRDRDAADHQPGPHPDQFAEEGRRRRPVGRWRCGPSPGPRCRPAAPAHPARGWTAAERRSGRADTRR